MAMQKYRLISFFTKSSISLFVAINFWSFCFGLPSNNYFSQESSACGEASFKLLRRAEPEGPFGLKVWTKVSYMFWRRMQSSSKQCIDVTMYRPGLLCSAVLALVHYDVLCSAVLTLPLNGWQVLLLCFQMVQID